MPWEETFHHHFERPLDSLEILYRTIRAGGLALKREHFAITAVVQCQLSPSIEHPEFALKDAWKAMRYDHPQIAAFVGPKDTFIYEVPTNKELNSWLSSTFVVEPPTMRVEEIYGNSQPSEFPEIHYLPHSSEILLRSSHWRIDGIGALHLLNNLLKVINSPRNIIFGSEGKNLIMGLDEAARVCTDRIGEIEEAAASLVAEFTDNLPSIGLPTTVDIIPAGTQRSEMELPKELTSAIILQCKSRGFSVTSAAHAAVTCATMKYSVSPLDPTNKYVSWAAFDLRKYCPSPYNGADNPVSIFHTGTPVTIFLSEFLDMAQQFNKTYSRKLNAPGPGNLFAFLPCYVGKCCTLFTQSLPPGATPPCEPNLSSLGIIDDFLCYQQSDKVKVTDFWLGVEMLTQQLMVYVWTRQGKMKLSVCYNESFYNRTFAENFVSTVRDEIVMGLGV